MPDNAQRMLKQTDFSAEEKLLQDIRNGLTSDRLEFSHDELSLLFDPKISQVYVTLFQPPLKPIRWGSRRNTLNATLRRIVDKLKANPRYCEFSIQDPDKCRILFEMVVSETPCPLRSLTSSRFCETRFEPGITGIKYKYHDVLRYFMPTDAVLHSVMTISQLLRHLAKTTGIAKKSRKFSVREKLMKSEPIESSLIETIAFISTKENKALPLYRGYPFTNAVLSQDKILESTLRSVDWLVENMNSDGSFLYFYDAHRDSKVDFDHPNMRNPLYNNILRHCGGTITLLRAYELTGLNRYIEAARHSNNYLFSTLREHLWNGEYACYPFDNKKSKLGGAGIALVALMHFYHHTADKTYRKTIDGLVRHILSRVEPDGEMLGYYIHPLYNQGKPILAPPEEIKKKLFSFYYPGEALLGLALYYHWMDQIDENLKVQIREKSEQALDFLVDIRPIKYKDLFLSLPADAWLMQAIEEWIKVPGLKKQSYIDFVLNDAKAMISHSYHYENSPYLDYIGGFYYNYGDHVYQDGSRCEGLAAAYSLAVYLQDEETSQLIMDQMLRSAQGLMYTQNTPDSTYGHLYPEKSLYAFRFKLTRQWVRVDSVQHTACFFARLLKFMKRPPTDTKSNSQ
ncbi:protein containing Six-hairpin glycosidase-like domain protein [Wenzhouxiangella limi]|uniref:Protein containing Six-hairpin glycosidase-like domain protein n=1 Tax=Wenzhouxiangella limi TaxID=2707351 RepID=A0A845UVH6_9GAMM|nr:protein containing Six-hairpin glycosidase-like domain protein [Wenzhouxiangella limi]NDY95487.1 protein containing Six-hairpin glycosidase-like domain protein [Wenzhouxiangella limi]